MANALIANSIGSESKFGTVLSNISLEIEEGKIYGIAGENGSGKSTLLKILAGFMRPTEGTVSYPAFQSKPVIGAMIEYPAFYGNMTVSENLKTRLLSEGCYSPEKLEKLLEIAELSNASRMRTKNFTLGAARRLGIAMAIAGDPDILILDDPFTALSTKEIYDMRNMLKKVREIFRKTVIISGTDTDYIAGICDAYSILDHGRMSVRGAAHTSTVDDLDSYILLKADPVAAAREVLDAMGIQSYKTLNGYTIHIYEQVGRIDEIIQKLVLQNVKVFECRVMRNDFGESDYRKTGGSRYE